jgi:hypothetical protein
MIALLHCNSIAIRILDRAPQFQFDRGSKQGFGDEWISTRVMRYGSDRVFYVVLLKLGTSKRHAILTSIVAKAIGACQRR